MARKTSEELDAIKDQFGVKTLWSWSRYNTYKTDPYEYYLKYILRAEEDKQNSIYTYSGSLCHDILEQYYDGKIEQEDMIGLYEDGLLTMNIAEYKYDRNDSEKNENIANKYESCVRHFFKNHKKPEYSMALELFTTIKITDNIVFQGYIDNTAIATKQNIKHIVVTDYKTSTIYKGEKLEKESGQLLLYADGIRQKTGLPLNQITIQYLFLKYVTVRCLQANGKWKNRYILRNAIGESLISNVKMWLKKEGYLDNLDDYIGDMVMTNSINGLPQTVRDKFVISDCYVEVPLSEEKINELKTDIITTISKIEEKTDEYKKIEDENIFWQEVTDKDSYRLAVLSGYSRKLHKPYNEYLKSKEMFENKGNEDDTDKTDEELMNWLNEL